ncbi:MAG: tetratricopeptide repeat protein [Symploca sp. SIO2B6]|nr:tetratricopeptide repeat protein [Symploca sp. SIO2B6]
MTSNPNLVQRGQKLYQAGQFWQAATVWQQAATAFEAQGDILKQVLVLSYIASAWEQLGEWNRANTAINKSLKLLKQEQTSQETEDSSTLILAQILNTQGHLQLAQGQDSEALATWQQAETAYAGIGDQVGILGSQINQARALQTLGMYRRARANLEQVKQKLQLQPDSILKVTGLRNLGDALRRIGDLDASWQTLQQSLTLAQSLAKIERSLAGELPSQISVTLLSLGNTARAQGETEKAITLYRQAAATAVLSTFKIQALVNQLSLLVETKKWAVVQTLWLQINSQLTKMPPSRMAVYAKINLAQSLMKMGKRADGQKKSPPISIDNSTIAQILATALQQAKDLGDQRALSSALGNLGGLYEQTQQWANAQDLTEQALMQ